MRLGWECLPRSVALLLTRRSLLGDVDGMLLQVVNDFRVSFVIPWIVFSLLMSIGPGLLMQASLSGKLHSALFAEPLCLL